MLLQIVFREGPIDRAAQNFMEMFLQGRRLEQQERMNEVRKERLKLDKQETEQRLAQQQAAQQNALADLQAQQRQAAQIQQFLPQAQQAVQAFGGAIGAGPVTPPLQEPGPAIRSPVARDALEQVERVSARAGTSSQAFQTAMARLPAAAQAERQADLQSELDEVVANVPERVRPLVRVSVGLRQQGLDASVANTILNEIKEDLDPSVVDRLDRESQKVLNDLRRFRIRQGRRALAQAEEEGEIIDRDALIAALPEPWREPASALPNDDLAMLTRDRLRFLTQPEENAFSFMEGLLGRTNAFGEQAFSVGEAINLTERMATANGIDFEPPDDAATNRLRVSGVIQQAVGAGLPSDADLPSLVRDARDVLSDFDAITGNLTEQQIKDAMVSALTQAATAGKIDASEGEIRSAVARAFRDEGR